MKEWYTAKELASTLGVVHSTIVRKAKNEGWESQKRLGQGGGYEYHISNLPIEARKELEAKQVQALIPQVAQGNNLTIKHSHSGSLTHQQREVSDARATVLKAIDAMNRQGVTKQAAMTTLLTQAQTGLLEQTSPVLDKALRMAKDSRGRKGNDYPSVRTLKRWLSPNNKTLTPKYNKDVVIPAWAKAFLKQYQRPQKPSVADAYEDFVEVWQGDEVPSIHAVRRFLKRMGNVSLQRGRMGSREMKTLLAFTRRSVDELKPGDIYSPDGHTFDAEVAHPLHGRPFKPEITSYIDIATRKLVGFSVDLAESGMAVLDALIDSCNQCVPGIIYADNGSGYCNALIKDKGLGVLSRLGSEITHSLPYNSQARGATERAHKSIWIKAAKKLDSYLGADMDRQAAQLNHKLSRQALKEDGKTHIIGWQEFIQFCEETAERYNSRPHTFLPKITDEQGLRRHRSPNEHWATFERAGWQPDILDKDELAHIFRPRMKRTVDRCQIRLFTNIYFSHSLEEYHGDNVQVAFDIHDPQFVWIYELESGRMICKAEWNANVRSYMPQSFVMQAREKRADARLKRLEVKREEIEAERNGGFAFDHEPQPTVELASTRRIRERLAQQSYVEAEFEELPDAPVKAAPTKPVGGIKKPEEMTFTERLETYKRYASGDVEVPKEHAFWFKKFPKSKAYKAAVAREDHDLSKWG